MDWKSDGIGYERKLETTFNIKFQTSCYFYFRILKSVIQIQAEVWEWIIQFTLWPNSTPGPWSTHWQPSLKTSSTSGGTAYSSIYLTKVCTKLLFLFVTWDIEYFSIEEIKYWYNFIYIFNSLMFIQLFIWLMKTGWFFSIALWKHACDYLMEIRSPSPRKKPAFLRKSSIYDDTPLSGRQGYDLCT